VHGSTSVSTGTLPLYLAPTITSGVTPDNIVVTSDVAVFTFQLVDGVWMLLSPAGATGTSLDEGIGDATIVDGIVVMPPNLHKARVTGLGALGRIATAGFSDGEAIMLYITDASPTHRIQIAPNVSGGVGSYPICTPPKSGGDHGEFVSLYAPTTLTLWKDETGQCWRFATPQVGSSEVTS
jgi:hypothetical protein